MLKYLNGRKKKEIIGEVEIVKYCEHSWNVRYRQLLYYSNLNLLII